MTTEELKIILDAHTEWLSSAGVVEKWKDIIFAWVDNLKGEQA